MPKHSSKSFSLDRTSLENEKTVKIKGLGTFKLVDVDSRESVNVNTGERFQIKGHTKVSFTPDTNLRDTINKPFAHFETVVLNEVRYWKIPLWKNPMRRKVRFLIQRLK